MRILLAALAVVAGVACAEVKHPVGNPRPEPDHPSPPPPPLTGHGFAPLTELGVAAYEGLSGGLYPDRLNDPPADHDAAGRAALAGLEPLDFFGLPHPGGRIVFLSVGMSNAAQEFCSNSGEPPCREWSFVGRAQADGEVEQDELAIVNAARPGRSSAEWDDPTDENYDFVERTFLRDRGLSALQVQVVWVKQANPNPTVSLPSPAADAYQLEAALGRIVRAMKVRWPNLRLVFFSSRIYGGYAITDLNPEPYAYESGFAVRGVIAAQIEQARSGLIDPEAGDVGLDGGAPWLAWGPYLWADGPNPRADGLVWLPEDFQEDGTHPFISGQEKVAGMLLDFFKSSPYTQCWFLNDRSCL